MKKIFSDTRFLHGFYCTILLIVSYLLWFVYPAKQECLHAESNTIYLNAALETNSEYTELITKQILQYAQAYRSHHSQKLESTVYIVNDNTNLLIRKVNDIQKELQKEIEQNDSFFSSKYTSFFTHKILIINKMKEIKSTFDAIGKNIFLEPIDSADNHHIQQLITTINEQILWDKIGSLSAVSANTQLENIKITASIINIAILNFLSNRVGCDIKFNDFLVGFFTSQSSAKVGEPYELGLALCEYACYFGKDYKIYCDGVELPIRRGEVEYKKVFQNAGKQTIVASSVYKNPLTGQTETVKREYTIDVLPKFNK